MMAIPLTWINALFEKFERFYGQDFVRKWNISNVDAMKQEWAEGLARFEGETLRMAVEYCRENVAKPPSLPEFIIICKEQRPLAMHQPFLSDMRKFEKTEHGMKMMENIKQMLKNKTVEHG